MASATAATAAPATAEAVEETAAVAWAALSLISCTEGALGTSGMPARNPNRSCTTRVETPQSKVASAPLERILQRRRALFHTVNY